MYIIVVVVVVVVSEFSVLLLDWRVAMNSDA